MPRLLICMATRRNVAENVGEGIRGARFYRAELLNCLGANANPNVCDRLQIVLVSS
jgi:hypothetical protein